MLKRISIQNFKGIGPRVNIDLRPVTLLFGPNSAGKSTILHAIHFAHAVLESGNADVGRTRLGGDIDLGGFRQLVHNHDLDNEVLVGFVFEPPEDDLSEHLVSSDDLYSKEIYGLEVEAGQVVQLSVEFTVRWSRYRSRPAIVQYTVAVNEVPLATLGASLDGSRTWLTDVNEGHPLLFAGDEEEKPGTFHENLAIGLLRGMALPGRVFLPGESNLPSQWDESFKEGLGALLSASRPALVSALERFRYVGPIRRAPSRGYEPPKRLDEARWANGLGAWDEMCANSSLRKEVSRWLGQESHLDTGYRIEWFQYRELDEDTFNRIAVEVSNQEFEGHSFTALLNPLKVRGRLVVVDQKKDLQLAPSSLGEGIAQVVPVVAAALADTIRTVSGTEEKTELVAIEQPELHIHPRMQVVLGDLFLSQCHERQFLIETHSEHLMLRLLRRVRETAEGELEADAPAATKETVAVYYVEQREGAVVISELRISEDGEFLDRWPEGFFGERLQELL